MENGVYSFGVYMPSYLRSCNILILKRNLWDLLDAVQDHHNHPAARFAIFLAAFAWTVGILVRTLEVAPAY
jgi:hypothetical protein